MASMSSPQQFMCSDTITHMMLFLDAKYILLICSPINKQFHKCSLGNTIWKQIYEHYFMDSLFDWDSFTINNELNDKEEEEEKMYFNYSVLNKKRKSSSTTTKIENQKKKQKQQLDPTKGFSGDDLHYFNLFKKYFKFPIVDSKFAKIQNLVNGSLKSMLEIQNIEKLHEIISQMYERMNESSYEPKLLESFQYNHSFHDSNEVVQENYLKLAIILSVLFNGSSISYFEDSIAISLRYIEAQGRKRKKDANVDELLLPLPAFCMMILYPESMEKLPIQEIADDNMYYCAFQHFEDNHVSQKDCCFFTMLDGDEDLDDGSEVEISSREITIFRDSNSDGSEERGFKWCPQFFNAGSKIFLNKIHAFTVDENTICVKKFETCTYT